MSQLIEDSIEVLRLIDEALEANDPYNNPEYSPDYSVTLEDCFFPDCIEDPLLLLRETIGEEQTGVLEYIGDLELIAETLRDCIKKADTLSPI
jgi:hypothetical protein